MPSKLTKALGAIVLLAQLLGSGCGSGVAGSAAAGATANPVSADFPYCTPVLNAPAAGPRFGKYHLAAGAPDRDRLFLAVLRDDADTLTQLFAAGADANSARVRGFSVQSDGLVTFADEAHGEPVSLLHWAAGQSGSGDTIRQLLAHGANVRAKDSTGRTPLMEAAQNLFLSPDGLQALLDAGADVHERDKDQKDALLYAVSTDTTDHAALCLMSRKLPVLKHAGADINENVTLTPLMAALYNRNLGMAKLIHALGGDLKAHAAVDGSTALHMVARAADDNVETVNWLLLRGIDRHALDNAHKTALELFQENLTAGHCHLTDSTQPQTNLCAAGTQAIIKAIEHHHRR